MKKGGKGNQWGRTSVFISEKISISYFCSIILYLFLRVFAN